MIVIRDTKTSERKIELTFNRGDILRMLGDNWPALGFDINDNVRVYVNMANEIDDENPIKVFITRKLPYVENK